jgi:Rad3-related DNA helicase
MRSPIEAILGPDGPIARAMQDLLRARAERSPEGTPEESGYEARPQQLTMGEAVSRTLGAKGTLLVEAGTGVGKSFAYLVPAILRCIANQERVVIATNTIALQEQLIRRDLPFLMETIQQWGLDPKTTTPLVPALCKGRGNYVSIRRLKLASQRQDRLFGDQSQKRSLHVIEDWAYTTSDGTLASLPPLERPGVWDRVQSDTDNCMGRKCSEYDKCFYQKSRREMEGANLLICNHALYFADLSLRRAGAGFLPPYNHVILDEAHGAEEVACDHFGLSLSEGRIEHYLSQLYNASSGKGYLPQLAVIMDAAGKSSLVDGVVHATIEAQAMSRAFFQELVDLVRSGRLKNGRIPDAGLVRTALSPSMRQLGARLRIMKEAVPGEQDKFELNSYAIRAEAIAFDADALVTHSVPHAVYWIETSGGGIDASPAAPATPGVTARGRFATGGARSGGGSGVRVKLSCSPVDVGPLLREHFFSQDIGIVLTSATMATSQGPIGEVQHSTIPAPTKAGTTPKPGASPAAATADAPPSESEPPAGEPAPEPEFIELTYIDESAEPHPADEYSEEAGLARAARHERYSEPASRPSASLQELGPFGHIKRRLGCEHASTLQLGSPFNHASQARVIIDLLAQPPRAPIGRAGAGRSSRGAGSGDGASYASVLASRVLEHVLNTGGGAFVLFTSFDTLGRVADQIGDALSDAGLPMLVQGSGGTPGQLLERFRESDRSVLLGAASFWQGVDVKGHALRNVIITKLPFDPPDRPLVEARCERIRQRGGDPFREDSLPRAVLRFKQGFGRLIRSASDKGQVVILDSRVITARYGRMFMKALPPGVPIEVIEDDRQATEVNELTPW